MIPTTLELLFNFLDDTSLFARVPIWFRRLNLFHLSLSIFRRHVRPFWMTGPVLSLKRPSSEIRAACWKIKMGFFNLRMFANRGYDNQDERTRHYWFFWAATYIHMYCGTSVNVIRTGQNGGPGADGGPPSTPSSTRATSHPSLV